MLNEEILERRIRMILGLYYETKNVPEDVIRAILNAIKLHINTKEDETEG
jgi:DNA-directed RNA polymerase alpha subunit